MLNMSKWPYIAQHDAWLQKVCRLGLNRNDMKITSKECLLHLYVECRQVFTFPNLTCTLRTSRVELVILRRHISSV